MREIATPELTRTLEAALEAHQPPLVRGRRIKLRYAHQGGRNPPVIVIHGNQTRDVPEAYRRYLDQRVSQDLPPAWHARARRIPLRREPVSRDGATRSRRVSGASASES